MIVEDEDLVRMDAVAAFLDAGFEVLEASHAAEALALHANTGDFHLLFTDVNMPGDLDGIALAEHFKWLRPQLHIMITSALPVARSIEHLGAHFIEKPYDSPSVCRTARQIIGG